MKRSGTTVRSLGAAYSEFLEAPATGGYRTNEGVIQHVMGNMKVHDCPTFDLVREKYERKGACTFEEAFRACFAGTRDWRHFDLRTLQESHEEFQHLQLPIRVQDALERDAIQGEYARGEDLRRDMLGAHDDDEISPPIELLRRPASNCAGRASRAISCERSVVPWRLPVEADPTDAMRAIRGSRARSRVRAAGPR